MSTVHLASRENLEDCKLEMGEQITSPLGSATKDTLGGVPCKPPELGEELSGLGLARVQDLKAQFKLRSVFSKTGWVRRTLKQDDEILTVWDVPGDLIRGLHSNQRRVLVNNIKVPGKTRSAVVDCLDSWRKRVSSRPNKRILLPSPEESAPPIAKRAKPDTPTPKGTSNAFHVPTDPLPPAAVCQEARESSKAVKNDDAIVPVWLWNDRIAAHTGHDPNAERFLLALATIRKVALSTWKRLVVSSFWKWFVLQLAAVRQHVNTLDRGIEAIRHASLTSWWAWDKGSSPFFWRWPPGYQDPLRDGMKPMFKGDPPHTMDYQRPYSDEGLRSKEKKQIGKARVHGYLVAVFKVLALINVFSVTKGGDDIWMVYDGTKSGLNNMMFCPLVLASHDDHHVD
jgi:hypothetical protein